MARVITTGLVQRSAPEISDESEIYPAWPVDPEFLFIVAGPVEASGYEWYLVHPLEMTRSDAVFTEYRLGWVAAGSRDGEPWITPTTLDCPGPTIAELTRLTGLAALACFQDRPLAFDAAIEGALVPNPPSVDPPWLDSVFLLYVPGTVHENLGRPSLGAHAPPGVSVPDIYPFEPGDDVVVSVVGHFDDSAARSCKRALAQPSGIRDALDDDALVLHCRTKFVVTAVELVTP